MRFFYVLILTILFAAVAVAQNGGSVSGLVLIDDHKPLANATVTLIDSKGVKQTSISDANGRFEFSNVAAGKYTIFATLPTPVPGEPIRNLSGKPQQIELLKGQSVTLDLTFLVNTSTRISPSSVRLLRATVTVSASSPQTFEEVSKTVNVIYPQELRNRADFSLAETLRTIPGFRVQQLGGFGRTASIKTRGLRNQDTAVLIDGIRFRDASAITGDASPFLSDFTLTSIAKIEVLRGSGSSLYGTNAIGGTIDFQTPRAQGGWHGQLGGALGGLGLGRFRGNLSYGADRFGFTSGVSRTVYTKGIDGEDDARNTNFQFRFDASPHDKTNISARFFLSDAEVMVNSSPDTFGTLPTSTATIIDAKRGVNFVTDANDPDAQQRSKFFNGQVVLTQTFTPNIFLQAYYSGLKSTRDNVNGPRGIGFQPFGGDETYTFDGQIHTASAALNVNQIPNNEIKIGYEFELEKFGNKGAFVTATDNFLTTAMQKSNTFYVQDVVRLFQRNLNISGGFRGQWFSLDKPNFSSASYPNRFNTVADPPAAYTADASASYYFSKSGTKMRAHVGNGYRVPSLYERFGSYFFFGSFFGLGNPDLKPEKSIAFDAGVEQQITNRINATATYFYTKIDDEISYVPTDDLGAAAYYNFDKNFSRGVEFSTNARVTNTTDIFASYTFTNADVRAHRRNLLAVLSTDRKAYGVPDHSFSLVINQTIKRAWVNFDLIATSNYLAPIFSNTAFSTYIYRFAGNRKGDLTAGYTFGFKQDKMTARLYGTVENIFDKEYFENGFRTAGITSRIGLTFGF